MTSACAPAAARTRSYIFRLAAEEKRLQEEAERKAAEEAERQRKLEEGEEVPEEGAPKDEAQSGVCLLCCCVHCFAFACL